MIAHWQIDHAVTAYRVPCYVALVTFTPKCPKLSCRQLTVHSDALNCQIYPRTYRDVALAFNSQSHSYEYYLVLARSSLIDSS